MEEKIDHERFFEPPYPSTYVIRERVIVEEYDNSMLISVESEYYTFQLANQPLQPIRVKKACGPTATWRLIGHHTTNSRGEISINLSKFLNCDNVDYGTTGGLTKSNFLGSIPLFLATSHSNEPVFMTYDLKISVIPLPNQRSGQVFVPYPALDATVIVRSWRADGTLAPTVDFSWTAIGEKTTFINL